MMFWSAILLGLGGSLHCVAMCGPIAMALPLTTREKWTVILQSLLYNFGRISTYGIMGFFFGLMGWGISLTGYQNGLSIGLGIMLILSAIFTLSIERNLFQHPVFTKQIQRVMGKLQKLLAIRNNSSAYRIGLLNGLLPCGLVYIALAGSLATGSHWSGAFYMVLFGLGTLPLMLIIMLFGKWSKRFFIRFQQLVPYGLFMFGIYLVYRGVMVEVPEEVGFLQVGSMWDLCH